MADGSNSTMSEGDPPVAAQVVSGHLEMPGHLEMTPGQSPMETEEPSARARRRADEAEIAERGTPPKRPPPPAGNEGHPEMTGHLDIPQGGAETAAAIVVAGGVQGGGSRASVRGTGRGRRRREDAGQPPDPPGESRWDSWK